MARLVPVDLSWATLGYLCAPGWCRYIRGLDALAADAERLGVRIFWADCQRLAYCHIESRSILLSPLLLKAWPYAVRRAISHELLHVEYGRDDDTVREWQLQRYGELILPPMWTAA